MNVTRKKNLKEFHSSYGGGRSFWSRGVGIVHNFLFQKLYCKKEGVFFIFSPLLLFRYLCQLHSLSFSTYDNYIDYYSYVPQARNINERHHLLITTTTLSLFLSVVLDLYQQATTSSHWGCEWTGKRSRKNLLVKCVRQPSKLEHRGAAPFHSWVVLCAGRECYSSKYLHDNVW